MQADETYAVVLSADGGWGGGCRAGIVDELGQYHVEIQDQMRQRFLKRINEARKNPSAVFSQLGLT